MKIRLLPATAICLAGLLVPLRSAASLDRQQVSESPLDSASAQVSVEIRATLLPNFDTGRVDILGEIEGASCQQANLPWLDGDSVTLFFDEALSSETGLCPFMVEEFGRIAAGPEEGTSLLRFPNLVLGENTGLRFIVPGADVLAHLMSPSPARPPRLLEWRINGPLEGGLEVPIHPWKVQIDLTITPLLSGPFLSEAGTNVFIAGTTTVEDIRDEDTYETIIENGIFGQGLAPLSLFEGGATEGIPAEAYIPVELLATQLNFPPLHFTDFYPGLKYLYITRGRSEVLWFQGSIRSGAPSDGSQNSFSYVYEFVGSPRRLASGSTAQTTPGTRLDFSLIRLGEEDRLTVNLPNSTIINVLPPPSESGAGVVYEGPQVFNLRIRYEPGAWLTVQQIPFVLRAYVAPLERFLLSIRASLGSFLAFVLALALGFVGFVLLLFTSARNLSESTVRAISLAVWVIVGLALLYLSPAASTVSLLGLLALAPHLNLKNRLERRIIMVFIAFIGLDNVVMLNLDSAFIHQYQVSVLTPLFMLLLMLALGRAYYTVFKKALRKTPLNDEEREILHPTRAPAVAIGLLVLTCYEAIAQSLFAALILLLTGFSYWQRIERKAASAQADPNYQVGDLPDWLEPMGRVMRQPWIVALIVLLAVWTLGTPLNLNAWFTVVTLLATVFLFILVYEFLPEHPLYKLAVFIIPLMAVFFFGIGSSSVSLANPGAGALADGSTLLSPGIYPTFLNGFAVLMLSRFFVLAIGPVLIDLFVRLDMNREARARKEGRPPDEEAYTFGDGIELLRQAHSRVVLILGVLVIIIPGLDSLLPQVEIISSFGEVIDKINALTGSS